MVEKINPLSLPFFYDCIIEDNTIYFPLANYNALCKGSLVSDQVDIIDVFPDIPAYRRAAYQGVYKTGNFFLFFPHPEIGQDILIYNALRQEFMKLPFDKNIDCYSDIIFEKNNYIYIVSSMTAEIYRIDLYNNFIKCLVSAEHLPDNYIPAEIAREDDLIFFPLNSKRVLLIFDLHNEEYQYYKFPDNISDFMTLCYHDGELWITGRDRKIYIWNIKEKEAYERAVFPNNVQPFFAEDDMPMLFGNSFIFRDILWLFPTYASLILKYNIITGNFGELDIAGEEETGLEQERFFTTKYGIVKKCGYNVFFLSSKTRILYQLNLITNDIHKHFLHMNNIYNGQLYPPLENGVMREKDYIGGLEVLIEYLEEYDSRQITAKEGIVGKTVHRYINAEDRKI